MERLTIDEVIKNARKVAKYKRADADWKWTHGRLNSDELISCAEEHEQIAEWLEQLKEYEQAEEDGLLKMFPCKVGDMVYKPNPITMKEIVEIEIESIFITASGTNISGRTTKMKYSFCCSPPDFGKTVFLTKAEAEQALAKMKGE